MSSLIDAGDPAELGGPEPVVGFSGPTSPARNLVLNGKPAYELSWGCGTCAMLFRRLDGATGTVPVDRLRERLSRRADTIDTEVVDAFGTLLAAGEYLTLLVEVTPRLVTPMRDGDYFAEEQLATWGPSDFTGLPEYPNVAYYRAGQYELAAKERLFEFVVPMVPTSWNKPDTVADYERRLVQGDIPTAVAVSVLDVTEPAVSRPLLIHQRHWGLMHFLLDGHHKMQAAALTGRPVRVLSFLALTQGTGSREQALRVAEILQASAPDTSGFLADPSTPGP